MADDDDDDYRDQDPDDNYSEDLSKIESRQFSDEIDRSASYQIRPSLTDKFKSNAVKEVIHTILYDELEGKTYSVEHSEGWTKNIVTNVKQSVKDLGFKRYKLIVQIILGNGCESEGKNRSHGDGDDKDFLNSPIIDLLDCPPAPECKEAKLQKNKVYDLNDTYLITNYKNRKDEENSSKVEKLLERSVLHKNLEQYHSVPKEKRMKVLKKLRKRLREKTKGKNWFDMPATEVTKEIKTDFELLKMRSVLDNKHVYKKNDITKMPKYFHVGKVIEGPADFYNGRVPKTQRKKTIVDELLADAEFKKYQKKKFKEIMDENRRKKRPVKRSEEKKNHKKKGKTKR